MIDKSIRTDSPSISREDAYEQFAEEFRRYLGQEVAACQLIYCSWPQIFGTTAGPFPGIGGQAFTSFRMEAWVFHGFGHPFGVVFCNGRPTYFGRCNVIAKWDAKPAGQ